MIHIIHGDDHTLSRQELARLLVLYKEYTPRIIRETYENGLKAFSQTSLFDEKYVYVFESILHPIKRKKTLIDAFAKVATQVSDPIIIWEPSEFTALQLEGFGKNADRAVFKKQSPLFRTIEQIGGLSPSQIFSQIDQVLTVEPLEKFLYFLIKSIRMVLLYHASGQAGLSTLPSWQRSKIVYQSQKIPQTKALWLYKELAEFDHKIKTSMIATKPILELKKILSQLY